MSATLTFETSVLKILLSVLERDLFFWTNISQSLEENDMLASYEVGPYPTIWPAMRVYESGPIARFFGVNGAGFRYLEDVERGGPVVLVDRPQIADIFVEILVLLDMYAGFGVCSIPIYPWAFDIDLVGYKMLLLELSVASYPTL